MTSDEFRIAERSEVASIRERQRLGGRMWEDIHLDRSRFLVHHAGESLVAWVGLELDLPNALLRSLFTDPAHRRLGIGRRLVRRAEALAASWGVRTVYLFSTGAGGFFSTLGYSRIPVPAAVAATRNTPQAEWYIARPALLAEEVAFRRLLEG
jgi:N-acetylglutamate synthase-like GNAT family acetyltransferase